MPKDRQDLMKKMVVGATGGVLAIFATGTTLAGLQMSTQTAQSLDTVKAAMSESDFQVVVAEEGGGDLFDGSSEHLTTSDKEVIGRRINDSLTEENLDSATVRLLDNSTSEVDFTAPDGTPIKAVVQKNSDGTFSLKSATAQLDRATVSEKKAENKATESTTAAKISAEEPLSDYDGGAYAKISGLDVAAASEADFAKTFEIVDDSVLMVVPDGFSEQELKASSSDEAEKAEEPVVRDVETIVAHSKSWKDSSGSTVTLRVENLGNAFSQMPGQLAIEKMMGYWQETSTSVAEGSGQSIKEGTDGYVMKTFYDPASGMWGYWGTVTLSDGVRDIEYNRVAFLDEMTDQMMTVSYRHDGTSSSESSAMSLDEFKSLFFHAPGYAAVDDAAKAASIPENLVNAYKKALDDVRVLPGHTKSISQEKSDAANAEQAAEKDKAENQQ